MAQESETQADFVCQQCGECCRGEKGILVTQAEAEALATFLGLTPPEFAFRYLVDTPMGPQLATANGRCIMQQDTLCGVHPVKPRICRQWPFLKALVEDPHEFEAAQGACPGLRALADHATFVRAAGRRESQ